MSEYEPITAELRRVMNHTTMAGVPLVEIGEYEFTHRCDAIDAVHAALERENEELRERVAVLDNERGNMHETDAWKLGYDEGFASADDWMADNEDAMAEHGWVRKEEGKTISAYYVDVVPRFDWKLMALELEQFAEIVRGMAGDDEHYQLLPVDADGVPIRVGDVMENIVCPSVHREVTGVGVECFYGWDDGNGRYSQFDVRCYRHYHAPTVEDVLVKMLEKAVGYSDAHTTVALNAIAEYAAKLRLAGSDAE